MLLWDTSEVVSHIFAEQLTRFFPTLLLPYTIPLKCVASTPCLPSSSVLNILSFHYIYFIGWYCVQRLPYSILQVAHQVAHHRSKLGGLFLLSMPRLRWTAGRNPSRFKSYHFGASPTVASLRLSENSHSVCFLPSSWLSAQSPLVSDSSSPLLHVTQEVLSSRSRWWVAPNHTLPLLIKSDRWDGPFQVVYFERLAGLLLKGTRLVKATEDICRAFVIITCTSIRTNYKQFTSILGCASK